MNKTIYKASNKLLQQKKSTLKTSIDEILNKLPKIQIQLTSWYFIQQRFDDMNKNKNQNN